MIADADDMDAAGPQAGSPPDPILDPARDLPPVARLRIVYLIASDPRTGSNLLCSLLTNSGVAGRPLEYFSPALAEQLLRAGRFPDYDAYVADLIARRSTPNGVFGVKAHYPHFSHFLRRRTAPLPAGLRTVRLLRNDAVAQAVSSYLAVSTRRWTPADRGIGTEESVAYDFAGIAHHLTIALRERQKWSELFARFRIAPPVLDYETLIADPEAARDRVLAWLGIDPDPARRGTGPLPRKMGTARNAEWVGRFREEAAARGMAVP